MDNQHRLIKGYRELTAQEIDMMNRIKAQGADLEDLIEDTETTDAALSANKAIDEIQLKEAARWRAIAKTHFQQALMALTRSVAKPDFF